jgi:hypothetical protein
MTAGGGRDPLGVRLIEWSRGLMRWASSGLSTRNSDQRSSAGGCLNPLNLIKIVVLLLVAVFLPVIMLPLMLGRLATVGMSSLRYSSTMDVASGDDARSGHGILGDIAGQASVQAGLAAIAAHDPDFDPRKIMTWAAAAIALLCQSLTTSDATPARTFMANGLFRVHRALLELHEQAGVSCEGSWRPRDAALVYAVSTPLIDEVRVRVRCQGWYLERHVPTGLTLRGGPETAIWSEELTFGRSASAISPAAGGLPARHCPSCGAPLQLDDEGACQYCGGVVTAGRHDWVLVGWQVEPR